MKKNILKSILALSLLILSGNVWGWDNVEVTFYTIGRYFSDPVSWDNETSTIRVDIRYRGADKDYSKSADCNYNCEMTNTGYTYLGYPIYSYTFTSTDNGGQMRFKHYQSGVHKEDYTANWEEPGTMDGHLYIGYFAGRHHWVPFDTNIHPIYLDLNQFQPEGGGWQKDNATFKMYDENNTVWGIYIKDKLYAFSCTTDELTKVTFYRMSSDGNTQNNTFWTNANNSYNTYKVTNWNEGSTAYDNINLVTKTTRVYFDNSYLKIPNDRTYKYLIIGRDNFGSSSKSYNATATIANTSLLYYEISSDSWTDATYYGIVGNATSWSDGSWGSSNLTNGSERTAAYKHHFDLARDHVSLFYTSSTGNDQDLDVRFKGTNSSSLNTTQTILYALSTDGGSTFPNMNTGYTQGEISISAYKFTDDTYNAVSNSDNTATISSNTNGTYTTTVEAAYTGTTTLTASAREGYTFVDWNGASTPCYPQTATTYTARFTAHRYDILFDANDGQYPGTADGTMTKISDVVYDQSQTLTSNVFTRTGYTFAGWATSPTGLKEYNDGASVSNLSSEDDADVTLYALWNVNPYRVDVASVDHVTISATTPSIAEGGNANANYGSTVSLSYTGVASGYAFGYWKVYKTGDESTTVTVTNNQFTMPAYPVTVSAVMANDLKVWCAPKDFVFSAPNGGDHLTSTKDVYVHSTSAAGNLLNIQCSDFGSATEMEIAYLNADAADAEVDKASSLFRLYAADASAAIDAYSSTISISASRVLNTDFSIRYTPNTAGTTNHYKLRLTLKKGEYTLKTEVKDLYGRSLPEEFVIALKDGDQWYALPNNLQTSSGSSHSTPIKITVDNTTTPTTAVYAATTTIYKGINRNTETNNMYGIRFTSNGADYLSGSTAADTYPMWLASSNTDANRTFYLKSTDFGAYVVTLDPTSVSKRIGIYTTSGTNYIGYKNTSDVVYLLPITNKYTPRDATAYEWGEHGVIVEAVMTDVASATMHIDGASPTAATVTGINGSLGGTKYAKVDGGALTVGAVANDGKLLYIHWKNSGGTDVGVSQITMPCVIAADATMSDLSTDKASWAKKEVHILPGKTLTADGASFDEGNVTVPTMYVYPGATLDITTGKLTASTLRLRSGWTRAGTKKYDVARVHIASGKALSKSTFTLDYDIYDSDEGTHYYPIAVPLKVKVKDIDYLDPTLASASTYGTHYAIKRYNGARRAEYGAIDENWELVPDEEESEDVYIRPGEGYIMTGVGIPAYGGCIIRFPLDANDNWTNDGEKASYGGFNKNVIAVTHHTGAATAGGGANKRHEGWNMLANPYMACFATDGNTTHSETDGFIKGHFTITGDPADPYGWTEDDDNIYVSVPTHDFSEYIQKEITEAELLPGWSFFIQAAKDGYVTFAVAGQQTDSDLPIYAPKRKEAENKQTVKTGIVLSSETASDKTTFLISDKYSDEYEIGADLEKMFGNGYTLATYSLNNDTRLAFNAMSTNDAKSVIPVGIRIPADGSYTFSLNERYADADIERIDLIDYETYTVTNLTAEDYTFNATRSQNDERFAINITPRAQTPTDIGDTGIDDTNGVRKILLNETIYIIRDGRVYDATGKRVTTINK